MVQYIHTLLHIILMGVIAKEKKKKETVSK